MDKSLTDSLLFKDPKGVMSKLDFYYHDIFATLAYGELPVIDDVIGSIE